MPKGLSLKKKPPQPGQSSITAFFKNAPEKKSISSSINNTTSTTITFSSKRKATSPIDAGRNKASNGLHNIDKIIPLIVACNSPSNSPPLELSGFYEEFVSDNEIKTKPSTCSEGFEEKLCNISTNNVGTITIRKTPRKHEQNIPSEVGISPVKITKKIALKQEHTAKKNLILDSVAPQSQTLELKNKESSKTSPVKQALISAKKFHNAPKEGSNHRASRNNELEEHTSVKTNETPDSLYPKIAPLKLETSPTVQRKSASKLYYSPTKTLEQRQHTNEYGINKKRVEDGNEMDSMFEDEWNMAEIEEAVEIEDLDLNTFRRCEVVSVIRSSDQSSVIKVKDANGKTATCIFEGIWNSLPLYPGDTLSVLASRDNNKWRVTDCGGLVVLRPDVLLSSTSVVGGVFCRRKAVLQEKFRGLDCANKAMTIGILVHELLQLALRNRLCTIPEVQKACDSLVSSSSTVRMLYDADMSRDEMRHEMGMFVPQVVRFVTEYVVKARKDSVTKANKKADEWVGCVEKVLDIEENVVTPQLGLKGKIDVTLQVKLHNRTDSPSELVPLELKTGRASMSAEHRGQLILYMMMMSLQTGRRVNQGLLLYLKDIITLKVVTSGYPEQRDLLMLRNQLAQYLAPKTKKIRKKYDENLSETILESEAVNGNGGLENLDLPEPINHHACAKCAYLTICSLYQWNTESTNLNNNHVLTKLRQEALGHLSEAHVQYFLHWTALVLLEEVEKTSQNPLHHIWTVPPHERDRRGRCLSELQIADVQPSGDRFLHTFIRPSNNAEETQRERGTLSVGEYVVVSTQNKVWVAAGPLTHLDSDVVCVVLERDLTERNATDAYYHLDSYESQGQLGFNFTNLGALMDNDEKAERLRRLIIDRSPARFAAKLPREVGRLGARLLKPLNLLQQRAVLRAVAAQDYTLVHGMPGTGKTQTVAVLIQMLVGLGQKVLVTAHTHSAVDNVLQRLPENMRVLRLGSSARVSPRLARSSEEILTKHCTTPEELHQVYNNMDVIGVTCLGAGHSLVSKRTFDVCIVDESTQVVQSTALRALLAARRFVLLGDPQQLSPLVRSNLARKLGMEECVFSRLQGGEATVSLSTQYRMNARVTALANLFTYEGQLTCASDSVRDAHIHTNQQKLKEQYSTSQPWLVDCLSPRLDKSVLLLDTECTVRWRGLEEDGRHITSNVAEALVVMAIVKALIQAGLSSDDIGVITPYRDQVTLLKKCISNLQKNLPSWRRSPRKSETPGWRLSPSKSETERTCGVEVNTVDQYQGRDKSVIVYSCCKTWDPEKGDYTVKDSEILEDKRRLTVAITRAKHKLILIADKKTLCHYSTFSHLFHCLSKIDHDSSTNSEIDIAQSLQVLQEELGTCL